MILQADARGEGWWQRVAVCIDVAYLALRQPKFHRHHEDEDKDK